MLRAARATCAPFAASSSPKWRPRPLDAPVTNAIRSWRGYTSDMITGPVFRRGYLFGYPAGGREKRRSEEHTSELQSLMRISYAVFCLKKKTKKKLNEINRTIR